MDIKALFGLTVLPAAVLGGVIAATVSKRIRDLFFLLLVFMCPLVELLDVNYVSRDWYRGTSRGFEVTLLDVLAMSLLAGSVLTPRPGNSHVYWPASLGLMLLFFLYATFNVAISDPMLFGLFELSRMLRGLILVLAVAMYVRGERELRLMVLGMAMFLVFQCVLAVKQRYLDGIHRVPGTLIESNSLSVLLCTTAPVMVAAVASNLPRWLKWLCAATLPMIAVAEVLTISRAGVVIMALVLFGTVLFTVKFRITAKTVAITLVAFLGLAAITAKSYKTLSERFGESTLKEEYKNKANLGRGYYIRIATAIAGQQLFGVGLNNWSYWVSNRYGPDLGYRFVPYRGTEYAPSDIIPPTSNVDMAQAAPAHSLGALTLGEMGIPGFILFSLIWLRWFHMGGSFLFPKNPEPLRQLAVGILFGFCGMFLQNLTEWVFRHAPLYYTFHVMLGTLMGLYHIKRLAKKASRAPARQPEPYAGSAGIPAAGPGPFTAGRPNPVFP